MLILVFVVCALVGSFLNTSSSDTRRTRMDLDHQRASVVAEAGLDYGVMRLRDIILHYRLSPYISQVTLQSMLNTVPAPMSTMPPYVYQTPGGGSAFQITVDSAVQTGIITNGASARGVNGTFQYFTITCGAINPDSGGGAVLRQRVQAISMYVIRYGVFYEEDLEILPGPTMTFQGRVHSNADMYVGGPLSFYDNVTAHGDIFHRRKDSSLRPGEAKVIDSAGVLKTMKIGGPYGFLDCDHPDWMADSLARWHGKILSRTHGVAHLSPPINPLDAPHDIIERPLDPTDIAYNADTEREKFSNKAALRVHVDATNGVSISDFFGNDVSGGFSNAVLTVSGTHPTSGKPMFAKDGNKQYQMDEPGFYDVTQTNFFDAREQSYMAPVDIYVDELLAQFPELYDGTYPEDRGRGIVYVTRDDPDGDDAGLAPCVRVRNARSILPFLGLSIVSDLPTYVEGEYNADGQTKPCLVAGDAITFLSREWQDARSTLGGNDRLPEDTAYNLVVMTGNMETTEGAYNGGLENVLRFLENWSKSPRRTVTFRGSIIDLWESEEAQGLWDYGSGPSDVGVPFRYTAPTRDWGYDLIYQSQNPPGMTQVFGMEETEWGRITWADAGW